MDALKSADMLLLGAFRFDRRSRALFHLNTGGQIRIGLRALAVLGVLVDRAGDLVLKDEIMKAVWPETVVEDGNLTVQISTLRRILDAGRLESSCIQTISGRGYRFAAVVSWADSLSAVVDIPVSDGSPTGLSDDQRRDYQIAPLMDKPSIAVLPFQNMSGDKEQEYFVDGMVEEIITALSRIRWLFVIARNSTFAYKNRPVDVKQIGRELNVRYVLEGSVRKAEARVRITGQLIDAFTGAHLWADRFDGSLENVFELQDKIALSVAGVIEPALLAAEMRRAEARPNINLTAYDLYLRALAAYFPVTNEGILEALGLFEQAIAVDPHYGPALSSAAFCHARLVSNGWAEEPETSRRVATGFARRALQVGQNDPRVLANSAFVLAEFGEEIGAMIGLVDRALALNPSFARGWFVSGMLRLWASQPDTAIEHFETSLSLSPIERTSMPMMAIGAAHFYKREFDQAVPNLLLCIQHNPDGPAAYRVLAACYAHMGRLAEAHTIVARLRAVTPQVIPGSLPYRSPEYRELLLSGLRLALDSSLGGVN